MAVVLVALEFALQLFVELGKLLLALELRLLAQLALDAAALLQVTLFELIARRAFQSQPRLAHGRVGFASHFLQALGFALAQHSLLVGIHLQPAFGIAAKGLLLFGRKPIKALLIHAPVIAARVPRTEAGISAIPTVSMTMTIPLREAQLRSDKKQDRARG